MKWLRELFFPKSKVVIIHRGVHPMMYQNLTYAFGSILGEGAAVSVSLAECLTVHHTSGLSEDVQVVIKSKKVLKRFKTYLNYNGINFTEE